MLNDHRRLLGDLSQKKEAAASAREPEALAWGVRGNMALNLEPRHKFVSDVCLVKDGGLSEDLEWQYVCLCT